MASPDQDFSEPERAALLQEILRTFLHDQIHSSYALARYIRALDIQPLWDNIVPPSGRTMGQCKTVFQDIMSGSQLHHPYLYPRSVGGPHMPPPILAPPQSEYSSSQRPIAPRPHPTAPPLPRDLTTSLSSPTQSESQERRPKRGRPNRAESERRQRERIEAERRGEKDPYPSRSRKKAKLGQTPVATTQASSPHSTARGTLAISSASSMAPTSTLATFTTAPQAYSYSRAVLPPLLSTAPLLPSVPSFNRPHYEPLGSAATRSSLGSTAQSSSPGQASTSLPPARSLRSYSSERSPYRPSSTLPPTPSVPISRNSAQPQEHQRDSNGNHTRIPPPPSTTAPMEH